MAESAFNLQYIQNYSKEYATRVCNEYFKNKTNINGKEILEITELRQVNLLIIRDLYSAWQDEIEKSKGPYFNYNSAEVQEALNNLRNVLSKNILVGRQSLELLLSKAVEKTILLILSPYEFFIRQFKSGNQDLIYRDELIRERKYIKINTHLYDALLRRLEEKNISSGRVNMIVDVFNEVCEKIADSPEDAEPHIQILSKTLPLDIREAYPDKELKPDKMVSRNTAARQDDKKSLWEEFQDDKTDTIAEFLQRKTIDTIRKGITLNQKFMFVKELFGEDETFFNNTVQDLDKFDNHAAAGQYLDEKFFNTHRWQHENEIVIEFLDVVEKKFS